VVIATPFAGTTPHGLSGWTVEAGRTDRGTRYPRAASTEPIISNQDEIAEVHISFTREWEPIRGKTKDEQERDQMSSEWRARSNSTALRDAYQEVPAFHQPGRTATGSSQLLEGAFLIIFLFFPFSRAKIASALILGDEISFFFASSVAWRPRAVRRGWHRAGSRPSSAVAGRRSPLHVTMAPMKFHPARACSTRRDVGRAGSPTA
jgi:hypothetical protein